MECEECVLPCLGFVGMTEMCGCGKVQDEVALVESESGRWNVVSVRHATSDVEDRVLWKVRKSDNLNAVGVE